MPDLDLMIDGKSVGTASRLDVFDPATSDPVGTVAKATPQDLDEAVAAVQGGSLGTGSICRCHAP